MLIVRYLSKSALCEHTISGQLDMANSKWIRLTLEDETSQHDHLRQSQASEEFLYPESSILKAPKILEDQRCSLNFEFVDVPINYVSMNIH